MKKIKTTLSKKIEKITAKILRNEALHFFVMASLILLGLFLLYILSSFLSADKEGADYILAQGIHVLIVCCVAWVMMRVFSLAFVRGLKKKKNKHVPRYIVTLFNWGVTIVAILFITTVIFGQSAWALVTAGGIVGAGLAFSVQGIVLDMISGLILDVERTYKTGDWIRLDEKTVGEVIRTSWRHIEVKTEYGSLIVIPNRNLTSNTYENLSRFGKVYGDEINIALDHNVPLERAERVLTSALLSIPEVVKTGIYSVYAKFANEGGVAFTLRFGVEGFDQLRPIRHKVLEAVTTTLHANGMTISETIGEYSLSKAIPYYQSNELPVEDVLKKVPLFDVLNSKELKDLALKANRFLIDAGEDLIVMGDDSDSLFVIAEGAVDVIVPLKEGNKKVNKVVATLGPGNFVGDRALLLGEKRSATVRAKTKVLTYEVTKSNFKPLLKARPEIIRDLSDIILERQQDTSKQVSSAQKDLQKKKTLKDELMKGIQKFFGI